MINKERLLEIVKGLVEMEKEMNELVNITSNKIADWDSLTHLSILVALDHELGGRASAIDALAACSDTDVIYRVLKENGLAA